MKQYVTDTMALVSYIGKRKLPISAKQIFQMADLGQNEILIPAIVLVEVAYLSEKERIDVSLKDIFNHMATFPNYFEQPLSFEILTQSFKITDIPELHDRIIGGTALFLDLELITNDPKIQASAFVKTVW